MRIANFFRKQKFDIIHSWHWSSDFTEALAAKISGTPYVYTKKSMGWGNKAWNWRTKLSTKIITINSDMIPQFFENTKQKIVEIPLGVDLEYYKPKQYPEYLKKELGIKEDDFVIMSIANLSCSKRY